MSEGVTKNRRPEAVLSEASGFVRRAGFTLFEVIMALMILGLLSGAVYSISTAALETTKAVVAEQGNARRLEAFLRITRDAFLNLPVDAQVFLRITKSSTGSPVPEMVFAETSGAFGVSSLGGGSMILAARPQADGKRVFAILRVPADVQGIELERLLAQGAWIGLLPGVERVTWLFYNVGEWVEEWPEGTGRPLLVRLKFEYAELPGAAVDVQFWIPPLTPPQTAPQDGDSLPHLENKSPIPNEPPEP
jgi:prepilin-type N-terminal cleavage/methylation domain-containing protein